MANYNDLITAIDSVIKTNNRREITGQLLQNVLNTMVGSLGENYQLAGFATPTTNPHQPDQNVFYVASQAGVYTQFDNIVLGDGISFLMWKNGAWTSQTISIVTQSWVQQNFVSKEWFRKVFRVYDEDGLEIVPNDMDSVVDNIKAMVGLWTNEYLSALGMGRDGGGTTQTLAQLNDVQLGTLVNGDALVYNTAIHKWENKQIQTGVDMSVVWAALAANTNEQIDASHLATALSNYVTSANLSTILNDYATKAWAGQNFITVEWFDKLFQLYNGTEAEVNKIAPNGALPGDQTQLNIEAMFGFWTKKYISALGQGDDGTSYTTLAQLNDVTLTNPTANQVLTYNGTHWVNKSIELGSQTLADLTDVMITSPAANQMLGYDATTQKWVNVNVPDHYDWSDITNKPLTLTKNTTGFSISGGTTSKTLTVSESYTLGAACAKGVTDNSSSTAVSSTDTNLITARTLYYAGYVKSSGVTSVATGTGLTGGTITGSGTISINSTYQTYISHGETAYGWGNHANAGYVTKANSQTITGLKTFTAGLTVSGRVYGSGDDEGIVITRASNNYAGLILGGSSGIRSAFYLDPSNDAFWRLVDGSDNKFDIYHPKKSGTIALVSDLSSYVPLSGGTMTGKLQVNAPIVGNNYSQQYGTAAAFIFDKSGSNWTGIGANGEADTIYFSACGSEGAWVHNYKQIWKFNGNIKADKVQIGSIELQYDSNNNAIKVVNSDGTAASLYATGGVSALGAGQESGGGGDVTWALLASSATGGRTIHSSYIASTLSNYATKSELGGYMKVTPTAGARDANNIYDAGLYFTSNGSNLPFGAQYGVVLSLPYRKAYGNTSTDFTTQIALPNGDDSSYPNSMCYRTSLRSGWNAWQRVQNVSMSDVRLKTILSNPTFGIEQIANAPIIRYLWSKEGYGDKKVHIGSTAQYWMNVAKEFVDEEFDGYYSLQYGVAALISAITVARKVMTHEEKISLLETRVSALEKENGEQEQLISSLQGELDKYKMAG